MTRIETMKQIVANMQAEKIDGMWVDISSANVFCQIYDQVNEKHKQDLETRDLYQAMKIVWDLSVR